MTQEQNKERQAFEAWMRRDKPDMPLYRRDMAGSERFGQYCSMLIEDQWQAWQARAALVQPAMLQDSREAAERAYNSDAFNYERGPIGSHDWRFYHAGWKARALLAAQPAAPAATFQARVQPWMLECFGAEITADQQERNHRFLEEALELVQACGATASEAHQLVDYVYGRPVGEKHQEAGGVMVTLAALCLAQGLDMHAAGETELARIWTKVEQIRAKQAAKPKHSPLPEHVPIASPASTPTLDECLDAFEKAACKQTYQMRAGVKAVMDMCASPAALTDAVDRTIKTIERQLELIAERAPGNFLDKRPVVQSLTAHAKRLRAALLAAQPAEDALEAERTHMNSLFKRQPDETIEQHQERFKVGVDALQAAEPAPAPAAQADDWPMPYVDGPKQFEVMKSDPSNSHSPWLLRMPGTSACLLFNHEADDAIDEARCKWIAAACNAVRQQSAALAGPARADRQGVALSDDCVSIPRGLIGAACAAIDKKRDAPNVLAKLRRYTTGDLSRASSSRAEENGNG